MNLVMHFLRQMENEAKTNQGEEMKKTLILVLVLGLFFVSLVEGAEKIATSGGRYQLLQVSYTGFNDTKGTAYIITTVLKIDTETGKTYRLWSRINANEKTVDCFREIPNYAILSEDKLIDFSDLVPKEKSGK